MEAYKKVWFKGVRVNRRTKRAVKWAEKRSGVTINLTQGSYNAGGVSASGGTHDGGGAIDVSVSGLSKKQRVNLMHALKDAGFAAWFRKALPGVWGPHIHAILIGDKEASWLAKQQMKSFDAKRDGLARNAPDRTYRPAKKRRFSFKLNKPVKRK